MTGDYIVGRIEREGGREESLLVPRPVYADDLEVGLDFQIDRTIVVAEERVWQFAMATGDLNPLHFDDTFAASSLLRGKVVHGLLVVGTVHGVLHAERFWARSLQALSALDRIRFVRPIRFGDVLSYKLRVAGIEGMERKWELPALPPMSIVRFAFQIFRNGDGKVAVEGEFSVVLPNTRAA